MIKCNITACGTISRDASMRTTKEDKTFLTLSAPHRDPR